MDGEGSGVRLLEGSLAGYFARQDVGPRVLWVWEKELTASRLC